MPSDEAVLMRLSTHYGGYNPKSHHHPVLPKKEAFPMLLLGAAEVQTPTGNCPKITNVSPIQPYQFHF